jgi:hypothetical protein
MGKCVRIGLILFLLAAGCKKHDSITGPDTANVAGTWRGTVAASSCTPADVCSSVGFSGGNAVGIMTLTQNGSKVNGTYTYEGAGINAEVSGSVSGSNLVVDGKASSFLGKVTVHLSGTVDQNTLPSNVSHQVNLADGRSGTIIGSGEFLRQ